VDERRGTALRAGLCDRPRDVERRRVGVRSPAAEEAEELLFGVFASRSERRAGA